MLRRTEKREGNLEPIIALMSNICCPEIEIEIEIEK
jgi:hypothetical protein